MTIRTLVLIIGPLLCVWILICLSFFYLLSGFWRDFFYEIHWESVGCKIHVCQLNSKGSTGSQTHISGVILIFIAGMVGFRRNSSITNLVSLGHHVKKLTPSTNITKKPFFLTLFYWLKIENSLFTRVGFHCMIETTGVFSVISRLQLQCWWNYCKWSPMLWSHNWLTTGYSYWFLSMLV